MRKSGELRVGDKVVVLATIKETIKKMDWDEDCLSLIGNTYTIRTFDMDDVYFEEVKFFSHPRDLVRIDELQIGDKVVVLETLNVTIKNCSWEKRIAEHIGKVLTIKSFYTGPFDQERARFEEIQDPLFKRDIVKITKDNYGRG